MKKYILLLQCIIFYINNYAQYKIDPNDGPVKFINTTHSHKNTQCACKGSCEETPVISMEKDDRLYIRHYSFYNRCQLNLTDESCKNIYIKTAAESGGISRWFTSNKSERLVVWSDETLSDIPADDEDNEGLFVMHYQSQKAVYNPDWMPAKKLSYLLNNFYADASFIVQKKIDSTEDTDDYTISAQIQKDYYGYAEIKNNKKWGSGTGSKWSCNRLYWLSLLEFNKADLLNEMANWNKKLSEITGLHKEKGDYFYGIPSYVYEIPADGNLCKYPKEKICKKTSDGSTGKLYILLRPIEMKKGKYILEIDLSRKEY